MTDLQFMYNASMLHGTLGFTEKSAGKATWRYYPSVGSTNDVARLWLQQGAAEYSMVIADEQTAGRGRMEREWITVPGQSLAVSIILKPGASESIRLFPGLGAVAICDTLIRKSCSSVEIKWPNDILIHGKKVCGILTEADWEGEENRGIIMGIGLNIGRGAIPASDRMTFPASSLETECGITMPREEILDELLQRLLYWRKSLGNPEFMDYWQDHLAYRGQVVSISAVGNPDLIGNLDGIDRDGDLRIIGNDGKTILVELGDVHLRRMDDPHKMKGAHSHAG